MFILIFIHVTYAYFYLDKLGFMLYYRFTKALYA